MLDGLAFAVWIVLCFALIDALAWAIRRMRDREDK
jgi:uncharacterized membrane protein